MPSHGITDSAERWPCGLQDVTMPVLPLRLWKRKVCRASVEVERRVRWSYLQPAEGTWLQRGLGQGLLYHGPQDVQGGHRGVRENARGWDHLPVQPAGELVLYSQVSHI